MSISFQCSGCNRKLKARDELGGKRVKCPSCGQIIKIPTTRVNHPTSSARQPSTTDQGKAVAAVPVPHSRRVPWTFYAGGGALVLCLVAGAMFIFAMPGEDQPPDENKLALETSPTSERTPIAPAEEKRESRPQPMVAAEVDSKSEPEPRREEPGREEEVEPKPVPPPEQTAGNKAETSVPSPEPQPAEVSQPAEITAQDTPEELHFPKTPVKLSPGDTWIYLVSSSDSSLEGKLLNVKLTGTASRKLSFTVQLGDQPPKTCVVPQEEGTFLSPTESSKGTFGVLGIGDEYPESVRKEMQWFKNNLSFSYDANDVRTTSGYRIFGTGPHHVVTPAISTACAELEWVSAASGKVLASRWFSPRIPFAVRSRERRPNSTEITLYELHSYRTALESKEPSELNIGRAQRQKAIDWIKGNNKFGEETQVVDDLIFQLHSGASESPASTLRWSVGSEITNSGKGYRLEWTKGQFSSRELTAEESAEGEPNGVVFSVMK